jgi:hypothetical protein
VPSHCYRMRVFDRDLIRGGHYGQRSCETAPTGRTHSCTDQQRDVKISLANSGAVHTWHIATDANALDLGPVSGLCGSGLCVLPSVAKCGVAKSMG